MKPTVQYDPTLFHSILLGNSALVYPLDHTSPYVSNTKLVKTSKVVFYNETTGEFETLNTLYKPCIPILK